MNLPRKILFPLTLMLSVLPCAQAAGSLSTTRFQGAGWSVEQPDQSIPIFSARLNGEASHGDKTSAAILQVSCYRSPLRPVISLLTSTDQLGFNPDIYEGPAAQSMGPLSLTSGTLAPRDYSVNGVYSAESAQKGDLVFVLNMPANRQELHYWTTEAARGQPVKMTLPSAIKEGLPLTARFVLPQDDSGLRKVIEPCMKASGSADRR
ncbi:MAG: hypothetical protein NTV76_17780 [Pseudomonas sp.]|nr:hypothetical protein [Pseudomonas sp.]